MNLVENFAVSHLVRVVSDIFPACFNNKDMEEHNQMDDSCFTETLHYDNKNSLPLTGKVLVKYVLDDTLDMLVWDGKQYVYYNPYTTEEPIKMIDDPSIHIPANGSLASRINYNIWALREDIRTLNGYGIDIKSLIPKWQTYVRIHTSKVAIDTLWFKTNHTALYEALKSAIRNGCVDVSVVDTVNNLGAFVGKDKNGQFIFRDGDLVVML